jgi:hypothetical protein
MKNSVPRIPSALVSFIKREREREKITDGNKRMATRRCTACVVCVSTRTTTAAAAVVLYPPMHACACSRGAQLDEMRTEDGRVRKQEASPQSHLISSTGLNRTQPTDGPGDRSSTPLE